MDIRKTLIKKYYRYCKNANYIGEYTSNKIFVLFTGTNNEYENFYIYTFEKFCEKYDKMLNYMNNHHDEIYDDYGLDLTEKFILSNLVDEYSYKENINKVDKEKLNISLRYFYHVFKKFHINSFLCEIYGTENKLEIKDITFDYSLGYYYENGFSTYEFNLSLRVYTD